MNRLNEIDLLRFVAALWVVFFHYTFRGYAADNMSAMPYPMLANFSKYGYLGVQLFFMISGFVILMTAASGSLSKFAISRIVRLFPAFWACCTITYIATITIGGERFSASLGQYLINMTMLSEFFRVASIDGAYWSLFVELKFYALVTVVLAIGKIRHSQWLLYMWVFALVFLEFINIKSNAVKALQYVLIADHAPFFIAGATFYLVWSRGVSFTRVGLIMVTLCLSLLNTLERLPSFKTQYNTNISAFAVSCIIISFFAMMLLVSLGKTGILGRIRWLLAGVITYPLYLVHQYVGFMVFNIAYPAINPHLLLWGTIICMLGFAYAVHVLVERRYSN